MSYLDNLRVFATVVETGSFSAAAKKLGISTPVVSKRVSALEAELDTRLLFRTTRKISLSEAGNVFYQHCERILTEAREAKEALNYLNAEPRGKLRITAPVTFGTSQLAIAIPDFMALYPEISVELDVTDRPVDLADEGYDLAIRITKSPPEGYIAKKLTETRRIVCAAPSYWDKHGRPQTPADLTDHNCLHYTLNPSFNYWQFDSADHQQVIVSQGNIQTNNTQMMLKLATGGVGVIMFTSIAIQDLIDDGSLEPVLQDYYAKGSSIYVLTMPNRYQPMKARVFIDFLSNWYQNKFQPISD